MMSARDKGATARLVYVVPVLIADSAFLIILNALKHHNSCTF